MTRQNYDKRTLRKAHAADFSRAIASYSPPACWPGRGAMPSSEAGADDHRSSAARPPAVWLRTRPLLPAERGSGDFACVRAHAADLATVHVCGLSRCGKLGTMRTIRVPLPVLAEDNAEAMRQLDISKMVREGLTGEVTVLMFGQTSAGKSYTMDAIRVAIAEELGGHAAAGIFDDGRCQLQCFELHGDHVADLMGGPNAGSRPVLRTDASGQVHVCNISSVDLASPSDLLRALEQATSRRQTHETTRNDASSRSHAFYWIRFSLSARPDGKLTLIDLAGSERSLDSMYHAAEQRKQGAQINASLATLKECIRQRSQSGRVPARESKLTMLLQHALCGHAAHALVVVACCSPCSSDAEHTLNTVRNAMSVAGGAVDNVRDGRFGLLTEQTTFALKTSAASSAAARAAQERAAHPKNWTNADLVHWLQTTDHGAFASCCNSLSRTSTGRDLMRWPQLRFDQLCGSPGAGARLRTRWLAERDEAAARQAAAAQQIRRARELQGR